MPDCARSRQPEDRSDVSEADELWRQTIRLGMVPYYMFVERAGERDFLARFRQVSGLAHTVRGPSMSVLPGKVVVKGMEDCEGANAFVLKYLQARDPDLVGRPFLARLDAQAVWFDQLKPLRAKDERFSLIFSLES